MAPSSRDSSSPGDGGPSLNPERFGRYLLLDRIDVGGMAEVFRGRMGGVEGFERMVALKRILPNIAADPDFVDMFIDEAKLAVQLQHANIAQIHELGKAEGSHFIAMEYVSGVSLRTMWDRARARNRLLPIAMSCHVMQKVCEGLDAAHRKKDDRTGEDIGLVHRDVSPQNVLVSFEGEIKVIDFGIAKAANKVSKTQAGVLKGKFGYMSPEQVRGVDLDNRSDVFACGVVLYELLVGDRLFLGESDFSTLEKIRNVEMVPPTRLNKNLSPHLERIVMRALSKSRESRYRWASEMAEELQRYLFATNQPFARTDLQRYMQQHFKKELAEEKARFEAYRHIQLDTVSASSAPREIATEVGVGALAGPAGGFQALPHAEVMAPSPMDFGFEASEATAARVETTAVLDPLSVPAQVKPGLPTWAAVLIGMLATSLLVVVAGLAATYSGLFVGQGGLNVSFEPRDGSFYLDNRLLAKGSPVDLEGVEAGTHVVRVARPGFEEVVRPVRVESGQTAMVNLRLQPLTGEGRLAIRTVPEGLEVWMDGKPTGRRTPVSLDSLPTGLRRVSLRNGEGDLVHRFNIELVPGQLEELDIPVAELPPALDVRSTPSGADVRINGLLRGRTPASVSGLEAGTVRVELRKEGCQALELEQEVRAGLIQVVDADLSCP